MTSSRLALRSPQKKNEPVMLPPGCARLATMPVSTGLPTMAMTMGMLVVAFLAARAAGGPA